MLPAGGWNACQRRRTPRISRWHPIGFAKFCHLRPVLSIKARSGRFTLARASLIYGSSIPRHENLKSLSCAAVNGPCLKQPTVKPKSRRRLSAPPHSSSAISGGQSKRKHPNLPASTNRRPQHNFLCQPRKRQGHHKFVVNQLNCWQWITIIREGLQPRTCSERKLRIIIMTKQAFVLRLKGYEEISFRDDVVGIGWSAAGLDQFQNWEQLKERVRKVYKYESERALGNVCGSIWRFMREMNKGDLVVVPLHGKFRVAKLLDDDVFYFEAGRKDDFVWRRHVEWLDDGKAVPRAHASGYLQARMKCQQTCVSATDLLEDIKSALTRSEPVSFKGEILNEVRPKVVEHLFKSLTPTRLEELLKKIFQRKGFKAVRLPTRQSKKGDIDVRFEVDLGKEVLIRPLVVGIQAKQHDGVTDEYAVKQVMHRLESGDIHRGVVVTTAESFSQTAVEMAEQLDIDLVSRDELVNWIIASISVLD